MLFISMTLLETVYDTREGKTMSTEEKPQTQLQKDIAAVQARNSGSTSAQMRSAFVKESTAVLNQQRPRQNLFDAFEQINSHTIKLTNTRNDLIVTVHRKKSDPSSHMLKLEIGRNRVFFDAAVSFVVSEVMRMLTDTIVPDELKPDYVKNKE